MPGAELSPYHHCATPMVVTPRQRPALVNLLEVLVAQKTVLKLISQKCNADDDNKSILTRRIRLQVSKGGF